jgi:hypothetical protein
MQSLEPWFHTATFIKIEKLVTIISPPDDLWKRGNPEM